MAAISASRKLKHHCAWGTGAADKSSAGQGVVAHVTKPKAGMGYCHVVL